ncbi:hypothetical protein JE959_001754 [Aeromonas veronii]|nr:hypothetical protein [Aeromonas veronii]
MAKTVLTIAQKNKIEMAVAALNEVTKELQEQNPDCYINWYLEDNDNLNLMEEDSHGDDGAAQKNKVIELFSLDNSSGGNW